MEVRPCGECSLCCKLLSIHQREEGGRADFPFDKPAGTWCKHCNPGHGSGSSPRRNFLIYAGHTNACGSKPGRNS